MDPLGLGPLTLERFNIFSIGFFYSKADIVADLLTYSEKFRFDFLHYIFERKVERYGKTRFFGNSSTLRRYTIVTRPLTTFF